MEFISLTLSFLIIKATHAYCRKFRKWIFQIERITSCKSHHQRWPLSTCSCSDSGVTGEVLFAKAGSIECRLFLEAPGTSVLWTWWKGGFPFLLRPGPTSLTEDPGSSLVGSLKVLGNCTCSRSLASVLQSLELCLLVFCWKPSSCLQLATFTFPNTHTHTKFLSLLTWIHFKLVLFTDIGNTTKYGHLSFLWLLSKQHPHPTFGKSLLVCRPLISHSGNRRGTCLFLPAQRPLGSWPAILVQPIRHYHLTGWTSKGPYWVSGAVCAVFMVEAETLRSGTSPCWFWISPGCSGLWQQRLWPARIGMSSNLDHSCRPSWVLDMSWSLALQPPVDSVSYMIFFKNIHFSLSISQTAHSKEPFFIPFDFCLKDSNAT